MLQPYRCPGCMNINASGLEVCPHCGHEWGTPAAQPHHIAPGSTLKGRYTVGIVQQENADSAAYLAYDEKSGQAVILREYFPLRHAVRSAESVLPAANASNEFRTGLRAFLGSAKEFVRKGTALAAFEANGTAYLVSPVPGAPVEQACAAAPAAPIVSAASPAPKKSGFSRPVKAVLAVVAAILILLGLLFLIGGLSDLGRGDGDLVKVPDLCGRDVEEASSILELHGISLVIVRVEYSEEPRDSVLTQEPAAGESVYEGSVVQVTLSKGEAPLPAEDGKVLVADVIYMTEAEARALLEQQGLVVITVEAESDEVQKGLVISQDPVLDTELEEGATVTLTVSIGSKKQEEAVSKPKPKPKPTAKPTEAPVEEPTPTPAPTATPAPTMAPNVSSGGTQPAAPAPTAKPTAKPTAAPTAEPTAEPTAAPTAKPTAEPTAAPTEQPAEPTPAPTAAPTPKPEATPVPTVPPADDSVPAPESPAPESPVPESPVPEEPVVNDPVPGEGGEPTNP